MDQRKNKKWKYSLANFVQTFFPSPKIQQNNFGILSLHSLDKFPIFSVDENDEQSCIFVDAITWLKYGLRINWPYLVHFCIESKLIKRIAFIRPLPFGNRIFRFAFISPIFAFNVFGHSQIELLDGLKIESFSAIELEGIEIEMAKTIQIKLVDGGKEEENGMCPPFLDNNNLAKRDEAIKEFFSTLKLIYDGDLFNVKNWIYEAKFPSSQEGNNEEAEKFPKFVEFGQSKCIELANNNKWQYKFPQKYSRIDQNYLNRNFIPKSIKKLAKEISLQFLPFFTPKKCIKNGENIQRIQIINPIILLQIESNEGAILAMEELAFLLDVRLTKLNCLIEIWEEGQGEMGKCRQKIEEAIENVAKLGQCICWIQEIGILFGHRGGTMGKDEFDALLGSLLQWIRPKYSSSHSQIIFIITCSSMEREEMPERLKKLIHWEFALEDGGEKLDEKERNNYLWQNIMMKCEMNYEGWDLAIKMAKKTKGMTLFELDGLIFEAKKMAFNEGEMQGKKPTIRLEYLEEALKKRKNKGKGTKLGVNLADVGGLDEAKMLLKEALAELVKQNDGGGNDWDGQIIRRRSGILLYGPPGCGKTLLAKAVANEFGLAFLSVKGPELLSQYVGESEKNLRELFAKGRKNAPAVLFFDELDSLAPRRGGNTDSGGVMNRMVSQLLTELDNCQWNKEKPIFVMGATNRADLLDPCLLAPGRFEKLVPILPATNLETKEAILGALCKNVKLAPGLSIHEIAQKCPKSMSGADLAGLVRVKLLKFN